RDWSSDVCSSDLVGFEPFCHRLRLLRGAAVRLVDRDVDTLLLLPVRDEGRVDLLIELPRNVVGTVEDGRLAGVRGNRRKGGKPKAEDEAAERGHGMSLSRSDVSVLGLEKGPARESEPARGEPSAGDCRGPGSVFSAERGGTDMP